MSVPRKQLASYLSIIGICTTMTGCVTTPGYEKSDDFSQWPRLDKNAPGSVAANLNPHFKDHAMACGIPSDLNGGRNFIPEDIPLQTRNRLGEPAEALDVAGGSLLLYIFKPSEIASAVTAPSISRFLTSDFEKPDLIVQGNTFFSGYNMLRSCAGYVAGNLSGSIAIPAVAARAAVAADAKKTSTLTVIGGHFVSPIRGLLAQNDWQALYTKLQLWSMYKADPDGLALGAMYMNEFDGVMLQRVGNVSMNADFELNTTANLGSVTGKLSAGLSSKTFLDSRNLQTVIFSDVNKPDQRVARFKPLPTLQDIQRDFDAVAYTIEGADYPLRKNLKHTHTRIIAGIPASLCNNGWQFIVADDTVFQAMPKPTIETDSIVTMKNGINVPECKFKITGIPKNDLFGNLVKPVTLRGTIKNTVQNIGTKFLELNIEQQLSTTNQPTPTIENSPVSMATTASTSGFRAEWVIKVNFDDHLNPVNKTHGTKAEFSKNFQISCLGSQPTSLSYESSAQAESGGTYYIRIRTRNELLNTEYDAAPASQVPCSLINATLNVPLAGVSATPVTVPINADLYFPQKRVATPVAALPQPAVEPK